MKKIMIILIACVLSISFISTASHAGERSYEVTITNITSGQTFTPVLLVTHKKGVKLFTPGSAASAELAMLAEGGATGPLADSLMMDPRVGHITTTGGPLGPGETVVAEIPGGRNYRYLSLAAMMLPTNDGFISLNGVWAPRGQKTVMYLSPAYDAGSEDNDESCDNIPGPFGCDGSGEPFNEADGEGYVHIHAGIHGIGDLDESVYDWRNPVARIVIKRIHAHDDD